MILHGLIHFVDGETVSAQIVNGTVALIIYTTIAWIILLLLRAIFMSPYKLWRTESERAKLLEERIIPKLKISFDANPPCTDIADFNDGTQSKCIRLKVENTGNAILSQCEGWLSIKEIPNLAPLRVFWTGFPESISTDLRKGVPRLLQVFRIHQSNIIIPATLSQNGQEVWPLGTSNKFSPGDYHFEIALKGHDESETIFCTLLLHWNGNWQTSRVENVTR